MTRRDSAVHYGTREVDRSPEVGKREGRQLGSVPRHILALLAVALATASCAPAREHKLEGRTMGTTLPRHRGRPRQRLGPPGEDRPPARGGQRSLSTYRPESEINRFSRSARAGEEFPVSRDFLEVMRTAARVHALSGGAWDGTVRPLVDLWGFGPVPSRRRAPGRRRRSRPSSARSGSRRSRSGSRRPRQAPGLGDPRPVLDREGLRRRPGGGGDPPRGLLRLPRRDRRRGLRRPGPAGTGGPGGWGSTARGPTPRPTRSTGSRPCATRRSPRAATTVTSSSGTACATRTSSTRGPAAPWRTAS